MPPIRTVTQWTETFPTPPRYKFCCALLPANTGSSHPIHFQFDDRTIELDKSWGSFWINIYLLDRDEYLGFATFAASAQSVICDGIEIPVEHQHQGIGTHLYDLAEALFGLPTVPSLSQSDDAQAFWAKRSARTKTTS